MRPILLYGLIRCKKKSELYWCFSTTDIVDEKDGVLKVPVKSPLAFTLPLKFNVIVRDGEVPRIKEAMALPVTLELEPERLPDIVLESVPLFSEALQFPDTSATVTTAGMLIVPLVPSHETPTDFIP